MSEAGDKGAAEGSEKPTEESSGFRVIDRRRFAADGSEREAEAESPSERERPRPAAAEAAAPASPSPMPEAPPAGTGKEGGAAAGPDFVMSEGSSASPDAYPEASLSTLLLSLSTQALMHLGEIPDLSTGKAERDLPAARSIIDLIAVLEKKTRGNLDAAEATLLDRILYDLRMRFVEISRS